MTRWRRRARPLLGTLVEVGVESRDKAAGPGADADADLLIDAAFVTLLRVQACLSRFDAGSDVSRFHALRAGQHLRVRPDTAQVLVAVTALRRDSAGLFDISLGSAPEGWCLDGADWLRLDADALIDLGGIGKGHAVDAAVAALQQRGCAGGWVNAGGDLRAFGAAELPLLLRDEAGGGARPFARLADGAFATSHYGPGSRSRLAAPAQGGARPEAPCHASVAAPLCLWADALTKIVALSGDAAHPLLARHGATGFLH
jgi:thiamine biosynthesis lipoprotein